jgi:hypothetical protein
MLQLGYTTMESNPDSKKCNSGEYMHGHRARVVKGSQDIDAFNQDKINGVDGNHPPPCPPVGPEFKDYCSGWNQGYSDIVVDELDYPFSRATSKSQFPICFCKFLSTIWPFH